MGITNVIPFFELIVLNTGFFIYSFCTITGGSKGINCKKEGNALPSRLQQVLALVMWQPAIAEDKESS